MLALTLVVAAALVFAWTNGVHDAANAVATSLATGALTPRVALAMSALLNVVGALLGVGLAELVGARLVDVPISDPGLGPVAVGVLTAVGWNLLTWWRGLPSSSSQALIGALAGAGTGAGTQVDWSLLQGRVLLAMLASPVIGFLGAWLLMNALLRAFRNAAHGPAMRRFRMAQGVSAAAMSVGHGLGDGQRTMAVVVLALVAGGRLSPADGVPVWVRVSVALALGLGTASGGWRIIRTLSRRVVVVDPVTGFAAQSVAASVLFVTAGLAAVPISSTQSVTAAIMGAGSTAGVRAIRWGTVRQIALAWVLTPLVTFGVAAAVVWSTR